MKLAHFLGLTLLSVAALSAEAQKATVSPLPQSIEWGKKKAFSSTATFVLKGDQEADKDAVALLRGKVRVGGKGIKLIIGEKGDAAVRSYSSKIPSQKEGYYLKVQPGKVVIAGSDSVGTYYGVQTFLQVAAQPEVMQVTIIDYPDVAERGVVEGFYGNPFSHADRISQFEFYGKNKMNAYVYGPKDDPFHGFSNRWRDPYPAQDAARIKELITIAHQNKVNFVWAVHPGNDIKWTDNDGDSVVDDFKACVNKFEMMYALGVRAFAVFFDDIGGIGTDPANQAKMLNYLTSEFVNKKKDVAPLILCPTQYNKSWSGGPYLSILGTQLDKSVRIMWTGNSVVDMINEADMEWINNQIGRKAYIWLNYPVTDYVIDHLLMGPTYGNDQTIANQVSGFVSNPMEYAEASKVALYSIADYTWNMKSYDSNASWQRALKALMPENEAAFRIFCENCVDLGPTGHGLRMKDESLPFKAAATLFMEELGQNTNSNQHTSAICDHFVSFKKAATELISSTSNPAMIAEIKPWLQVFSIIGDKGLAVMSMHRALQKKDSVSFISEYQRIDSLERVQKEIISRNFQGSIKSPNPKPANEVVAPFIKQLKAMLVSGYKREFKYRTDVFPQYVLEEGRYYIKYNGKYLTNSKDSPGKPIFVAAADTINPQRQEWSLSIDPLTDRYKLVNVQDSQYLNEQGQFGTNKFDANWNTYQLLKLNGKYAIQNAGMGGNKFWIVDSDALKKGSANKPSEAEYVFEITPIGNR